MKGVLIAIIFFVLGLVLSPFVPVHAEQRTALSDVSVDSVQRVPFDAVRVYSNEVRINVPGLRYAQVTSNSMAPIITDKSVVFEKPVNSPNEIVVGDVISFYEPSEDSVILHAVIEVMNVDGHMHYRTQGVANMWPDPWLVPFENVKGIMVGTFR